MTTNKLNLDNLSPEEKKKLLAKLLQQKAKKPKLFPTSFAQQRLWFLQQLEPDSTAYNIPAALKLTGNIDLDILKESLNEICDRHEILRTVFITVDNEPKQKILPKINIDMPVVDLGDRKEQETEIKNIIQQETKQVFDLAEAPLLRTKVLSLDKNKYILLVTLHHIITDYYSMRVLIQELATIYQTKINNVSLPLPKLELQYVDFAVWQRKWLESDDLQTQLDYWQQQLVDAPTLINLPTDFPRPQRQSFRGKTKTFTLPVKLSQALQELSSKENTTLFMTLLAGLQTLLYRYTEQADILVGSTVANRDKKEISNLIGLFVNNLIFRTKFNPQLTFKQLLQQVKETALSAYEHQELPYEYLVEKLQPERNLSHNPLFQVMFVLHNTKSDKVELPNLSINYLPINNQTARFDLSLDMYETESGLIGSFEYNSDLFKPETIDRLISHFENLLTEVTSNPEQLVTNIDILSTAETAELLNNFNTVEYSQDYLVHKLIEGREQRAEGRSFNIALVTDNEDLTYSELNQRVNQLARYLKSLGICRDKLVGILLNRDSDLIISLLAVLKTGAAYIPLDPNYPDERVNYIIDDAKISFLITQDNVNFNVSAKNKLSVINLDRERENINKQNKDNLNIKIYPQDLAYIIYTSGSTGKPKGVAVQHNNLLNFLYSMQQQLEIREADKLLAVTTISFDIAALEIYLPLITGATVVLATRDTVIDADCLSQTITENNITIMQATPATWRMLLDNNWQGKSDLKILCGGEALAENLAAELDSCCWKIYDLYGPTETTIWSSVYKYSKGNSNTVSIGKPIANTQFYILDSHLNLVPKGIPGELYIGGAGLARGYLHRGDLTAERFIPNPFVGTFHETSLRLYKTGDRVKQLPDGNLEYLGRFDNQVKIRGFRIELGEIEAVLTQNSSIKNAVVISHQENLIAYIIFHSPSAFPASPAPSAQTQIRQYLTQKLPTYMIPGDIIELESFPLTPNGKIDRKALPLPDVIEDSSNESLILPQNKTEETLLGIWQDVLNRNSISIDSNFFELGGHSLLVTRVISQVRKVFTIELSLRSLFEHPTIRDLGRVIDSQGKSSAKKPCDIAIVSREGELPLSFAQQRQWFLHQLEPDNPAYNISTAVKVTGNLDISKLQQCLNLLVKHQEVLQTAFLTVDGKPQLKINPDTVINLQAIDLRELSQGEREKRIQQLKTEDARQPFTIDTSPLMRVKLLQISAEENILLLSVHHIIADGWSLGVLVKKIVGLYKAFSPPSPPSLGGTRFQSPPELGDLGGNLTHSIQYLDYVAWQREYLQGDVLARQLNYWQDKLQDAPAVSSFPTDYGRSNEPPTAEITRFKINHNTTKTLKQISNQHQATLFMTVLSVLYLLLHRYTGNDDLVIGMPIANRERAEFENLIGLFANTLALRANLANNPIFSELLTQVRENTLTAYSHQDLPFEQLVDKLELERSLSYSPLFQIFLAWETQSNQKLEVEDLTWESLPRDTAPIAKFDMTIFLTETTEGIQGAIEYNSALYKSETIDRLTKHFQNLLNSIASNPTQPVSEIAYLDDAERKQIIEEFNQTEVDYPQDICLHQLFERQTELTPDAIALIYQQQQLTYTELNNRANELANYLQSLGVKAETKIGVMCDRNLEMIIALLAILKAGGCYIPLDPQYPQQRLDYILEDTQLNILLTETEYIANFTRQNITVFNLEEGEWYSPLRNLSPFSRGVGGDRLPSTPNNLAYIIYTSGSTGKPKGVAITHKSAVTLCHWAKDTFSKAQLSGVLASTSICFDLSVFEIFVTLATGGAVILAENALELPSLKSSIPITLINTVPSAARELLRIDAIPETVNTVNLAGEALPKDLVDKLYQQQHIKQVYNLYGPSEDTTYSTFTLTKPEDSQPPTIGKAITNTQTYILDKYLQPLPISIPGELYLSGAGLARGYYNRGDLTAEKFIPNPFSLNIEHLSLNISSSAPSAPSAPLLYKTGDLARYLPSGEIEYLGRIDNQIKLRGFRIELGEIETVLTTHPDVETAVIINRDRNLIAYIISNSSSTSSDSTTSNKLRQFVAERLPDYMIPAAFIVLDKFPLIPNGKIDRKSFSDPEFTSRGEEKFTPANTEAETKLVKIWQELLDIEAIGIKDNFFTLGGDSILAIQVIAKASQVDIQLTPKNLFQYQTISELAAIAQDNQKIEAEQGIVTGIVPLTPIQHWFFEQELLDVHHWNQSIWLEVKQPLQEDILRDAITLLLKHHDALRLSFQQTETGWQQVNQDIDIDIPLIAINLANYSESDRKLEQLRIMNKLQSSFNLEAGLLFKIVWFKSGNSQIERLLIIAHHLIIDGVSWRIIIEDLQNIYQQLEQGREILLPPKTTSWKQWSEKLQQVHLKPELNYWLQQKNICIDVEYSVPSTISESKTITIILSPTETKQLLQEVPSTYQTQINDILLTALIQTWQEIYNSNNLLIELEGHGREDIIENVDISRTVGWFTTIYTLVLNLSNTEIATNIKSIKEQIRAIPSNGIGYGILRYLAREAELNKFSQAEIRFNYLGQIDNILTQDSLFYPISKSAGEMRSLRDKRSCAIEIDSIIRDGELKFKWTYDNSNYTDVEMNNITQTYLVKLQKLIQHCLSKDTGGYTPSDFNQMDFDQDELDDLLDDL